MDYWKTRKEQIENDFLPNAMKGRKECKEELKSAAIVGACEERERTLGIIQRSSLTDRDKLMLINAISDIGIIRLLGY